MRDLVWSIDSRKDTVKQLFDKMNEKAADLFQPKNISFKFQLHEINLNKKLPVLIRQQLFLIFNESITNIVRHSKAENVNISFGNKQDHFEMTIADDGAQNKPFSTTGQGLTNLKMRAKKINATVNISNVNGFVVRLTMPRI
jgi:signal transduction histidine kinase